MHLLHIRSIVLSSLAMVLVATTASAQANEVVLHVGNAQVSGRWASVSDSTAAGGKQLTNADAGAAKRAAALASPVDYFDLQFTASAGVGYRLWIRAKATGNAWANDSAFVQFSDSVSSTGTAQFRIGTTSAAMYSVEDCNGCGVSGWGWNDNLYGAAPGDMIYFQTSGTHSVRVQVREDGISIDQIVLSAVRFAGQAPGAAKNDTVVLAEAGRVADTLATVPAPPPPPPPPAPAPSPTAANEVVLYAGNATVSGRWATVNDSTAAGGKQLTNADAGAAKRAAALASPADYFDLRFTASAGVGYRLWIRAKATGNSWANDSVFVQFSDSVSSAGAATYRIGTTLAAMYSIEDCSGCGVAGWGWNDNLYGAAPGNMIYFQTSGTHSVRVQAREDGISIDQIVLSAVRFAGQAPGAAKNDTVVLAEAGRVADSPATVPAPPPPPPPAPAPAPTPGNLAPVFEADPDGFRVAKFTPASAPVTVYLSASATGPETADTLTYVWDFGDGSPAVSTRPGSEASRQNVAHTYTRAGTFAATVTVVDQANNRTARTATVSVAAPAAAVGVPFKILQWNTYKGRTTDTRTEGSKIWLFARWMAAANPDVILLQEVMGRAHADKYKAELQTATGTTWSYFYRSDFGTDSPTAQGLAIFSKLPILVQASMAYTVCSSAQIPQRSAVAITVPVNGRNVTVFDTHLSSYSGTVEAACRLQQARELTTWAATFAEPRIITGDLNASSDEPAIAHLMGTYDDVWNVALASSRAVAYPDNPPASLHTRTYRIDYVLKSKGSQLLGVVGAQVPDTRDYTNDSAVATEGRTNWAPHNAAPRVSDHEMIIATFVVK